MSRFRHLSGREADDIDRLIPGDIRRKNDRFEYAIKNIEVQDYHDIRDWLTAGGAGDINEDGSTTVTRTYAEWSYLQNQIPPDAQPMNELYVHINTGIRKTFLKNSYLHPDSPVTIEIPWGSAMHDFNVLCGTTFEYTPSWRQ